MSEPEVDLLAVDRGTVTAPAGCGKTHLIAAALGRHAGAKPVLVLTHTNAGVAALRGRLDRAGVPSKAYRLSTIDGWALRLLTMFPKRGAHDPDILRLANPASNYPAIRDAAWKLLRAGHLNDVLAATYERLIVDEYQDCSVHQHAIVVHAAAVLPTCVLGDPMQAIFGFGSDGLADWGQDVCGQFPLAAELATPWRWINAGEEEFGRYLLWVRRELVAGRAIDLTLAPQRNVQWVQLTGGPGDHELRLRAGRTIAPGADGKVLIIADSRNPQGQRDFASQIPGAVTVEAVDMRDLVTFSQGLNLASPNALQHIVSFAASVMTGVGAANMMERVATLQAGRERREASDAENAALAFAGAPSYARAADLLVEIGKQGGVRAHRPAILRGGLKMLQTCGGADGATPADAAVRVREQSRLIGRPLAKRTVGSTLLLKGLEADVAVVLDPAAMDRKHLYVAMTRGAKQLVVCSQSNMI